MKSILTMCITAVTLTACAQKKGEMTVSPQTILAAAAANDTSAIKAALAAGGRLEVKDASGRTPLMTAVYKNNVEAARVLIAAGANVNAQDNIFNSPFLYAGAEGYTEIVKMCMQAGADYKIYNRYGGTALIPACERAHLDVIRVLLADKTFPVNHINRLGWTALLEAVILGRGGPAHVETVKLLLEAGADRNIKDGDGVTALQHARNRNYKEIIALLEQ